MQQISNCTLIILVQKVREERTVSWSALQQKATDLQLLQHGRRRIITAAAASLLMMNKEEEIQSVAEVKLLKLLPFYAAVCDWNNVSAGA